MSTETADRTAEAIRWTRINNHGDLRYTAKLTERGCWANIYRLDAIDRRHTGAPAWAKYGATYYTSQVLTSTDHWFETLREAKAWVGRRLEPWL